MLCVFNNLNPPQLDTSVAKRAVRLANFFPCSRYEKKGHTKDMRFCANISFATPSEYDKGQKSVLLCCMFDTGAMVSTFTKEAAQKLFGNSFPDSSKYVKGAEVKYAGKSVPPEKYDYFIENLMFSVQGYCVMIPVRFPAIYLGENKYEWLDKMRHNFIGMYGLFSMRMNQHVYKRALCFTEDDLHILELR